MLFANLVINSGLTKFYLSLSSKVIGNGEAEIMLRLTVSRELHLSLRSGVFIQPS
jgi:hypothetical protein